MRISDWSSDVCSSDLVLTLENAETGQVRGTCQIFTHVGQTSPFYSYRLGVLTQSSRELGRTFRAQMLGLTTDLEGSSEVGGLSLHPRERAEGLGLLLARSRYGSEEHTSELQSLMRISYAVFCLKQ